MEILRSVCGNNKCQSKMLIKEAVTGLIPHTCCNRLRACPIISAMYFLPKFESFGNGK